MAGEHGRRLEPSHGARIAVTRQHAEMDGQRGVETEVGQPCLEALPRADDGNDVKYGVVTSHAEVVHHAVIGCLEEGLLQKVPAGTHFHVVAVAGEVTPPPTTHK